jgi:K(+)-stimulated pyrophosphate-energized sodium pump
VTELALILGIQVAALAYSLVVGRNVTSHAPQAARLRRLASALERATATFSLQQGKVLLLAAPLTACALFALHFRHDTAGTSRFAAAATAFVGVLSGAALGWLAVRRALSLSVQTSLAAAGAATRGLDNALRVATRAGSAMGLGTEALSALGLLGLFGCAFALRGGTTFGPRESVALARDVACALASFPLGAALSALVCQRSGGTYQAAAAMGRDLASEQRFTLTRDDPRSPTLVGEIAGDHLGEAASRAALSFVTLATSQVAVLALALAAATAEPSVPLEYVLLPFVVRAFFVLGSGFGAAVVRTEEMRNPSSAVLRGYASATVIGWSGLLGAAFWLARPELLRFALAGIVGSLSAASVGLPLWSRLLRPGAAFREALDALRSGGAMPMLLTLGSALEGLLAPILGLGIGAALAWQLGVHSGLPAGGVWTSLVAWSALLGAAPFAASAAAIGTVASGARGVAALGALDAESQRRSSRLEETHAVVASARAQLIVAAAAAGLLSAVALPALARQSVRFDVTLLEPAVTWSGAIGAVWLLAYVGSCARAALRGGREVAVEVERQLRKFARESGPSVIPSDFSPSYKACVDIAARFGLDGLWRSALGAFSVPALLALALRLGFGAAPSSRAIECLMSCVLFAALVGLSAALALDLTRGMLSAAERARGHAPNDAFSGNTSDGAANVFGHAAAPAAHALLVGTAALALAVAPLMN